MSIQLLKLREVQDKKLAEEKALRIYKNFKEAISEVERDLVEMGIRVSPKTYQDKNVEYDVGFETLELQNYIYTVLNPVRKGIGENQPYCDVEFKERVAGIEGTPKNPGEAWKTRPDIWREFLSDIDGKFAYTYAERYARNDQVNKIIERLTDDPESRQLYVSMWDIYDTSLLGGISRVPCSLGYLFQVRKGALNMTYLMRSCDFVTHFRNDIYLSACLQEHIANTGGFEIGTFTHWMGSLHIFKRDAQGVF